MIVAERKPLNEIEQLAAGYKNVLILGCGTCVKVCFAGGDKEAAVLASQMRISAANAGRKIKITEKLIERQCEDEFIADVAPELGGYDLVISMACGAGVQMIAERFPRLPVVPAVNTSFLGILEKQGLFIENCQGCGSCELGNFGAVCPVARCSKSLLNGPCGGSTKGVCEVNPEIPCGWQLIIDRLTALGKMDSLATNVPPKNWRTSRDGGPRKLVREDQVLS